MHVYLYILGEKMQKAILKLQKAEVEQIRANEVEQIRIRAD